MLADLTEQNLSREDLERAKEALESQVQQRTLQLQEKIHELEKLNEIMMNREGRIIELKEEIAKLQF
jgi:hypothetical protein